MFKDIGVTFNEVWIIILFISLFSRKKIVKVFAVAQPPLRIGNKGTLRNFDCDVYGLYFALILKWSQYIRIANQNFILTHLDNEDYS